MVRNSYYFMLCVVVVSLDVINRAIAIVYSYKENNNISNTLNNIVIPSVVYIHVAMHCIQYTWAELNFALQRVK